jgi:hypothetical protein
MATSGAGLFCEHEYGLDAMAAVTPELVSQIGGRFERDDWPRVVARVANARGRFRKRLEPTGPRRE